MRVVKVKSFIISAGIRAAVVTRQSRRLTALVLSGISSCCRVSCPMQCESLFNYHSSTNSLCPTYQPQLLHIKSPSLARLATYKCSTFPSPPSACTQNSNISTHVLSAVFSFIFDVGADPARPKLFKIIEGDVLRSNNVSAPHTAHCLANGNIMISTMGDAAGNSLGEFILFDKNFECLGTWTKGDKRATCGYDFWYQPHHNIMISSEWGAPKIWRRGYQPDDIKDEVNYGRRLNVFDWKEQKLIDTIHLGEEGEKAERKCLSYSTQFPFHLCHRYVTHRTLQASRPWSFVLHIILELVMALSAPVSTRTSFGSTRSTRTMIR